MSLEVKNIPFDRDVHISVAPFARAVHIDNASVSMEDFCEIVKYVMVNADLRENDPRLELLEFVKKLKKVKGYNTHLDKKTKRLDYPPFI